MCQTVDVDGGVVPRRPCSSPHDTHCQHRRPHSNHRDLDLDRDLVGRRRPQSSSTAWRRLPEYVTAVCLPVPLFVSVLRQRDKLEVYDRFLEHCL